ncbi:hypothetical protein, partial [Metapseudomonas otitidis]|uniref:hypothetical protein n=1 Tax=Metapseudomonas otitidis TaxID=319939 RepID=UPI001980E880
MSEQKPDQPITNEAEGLNLDLADVTSDATATPQPAQAAPARSEERRGGKEGGGTGGMREATWQRKKRG